MKYEKKKLIFSKAAEVFEVKVFVEDPEYRVCLFDSFGHNTSADYFTDDKEDAKTTARAILKENVDRLQEGRE